MMVKTVQRMGEEYIRIKDLISYLKDQADNTQTTQEKEAINRIIICLATMS